ncbi:MAG: glycerophosphodiester phosphodiesterase family protein [Planctomycetaceae bacterium]
MAHRGVSERCPENTRAAFEMAVAQQADAIECDLQLTADGHVIVCHDPTLDRYGHAGVQISQSTLAELQTLDVGSWFGKQFADQRLMTLNELLADFGSRIPLFLELKAEQLSSAQCDQFVREVVEQACQFPKQNDVAFLAFDPAVLARLHTLAPQANLVLNTEDPQDVSVNEPISLDLLFGVDGNIDRMSRETVQWLHDRNLVALSYTCNSETDVLAARECGVDAIITNDPERTREILSEHGRSGRAS